uniref:uncharacterized protein LOC122604120 n=1 Tax=Erigeron canadensis TaxID=72917 RepID=UPI001CB991BC|nr:uncharacterized protein LOC122604120 [Erigeron canadensis]
MRYLSTIQITSIASLIGLYIVITDPISEYPFPSHVSAPSFVTVQLSGKDTYALWREQMKGLLDLHDMLDFIKSEPPDEAYGELSTWSRSDALVRGWILATLSLDILKSVIDPTFTAKDVWCKLEETYGPAAPGPSSNGTEVDQYQYPYPSHVSAPNFVTVQLTGRDTYAEWREQMRCLLLGHDMVGFVLEGPNHNSRWWRRSDELVKGWICATLSPQILKWVTKPPVLHRAMYKHVQVTASSLWFKLLDAYGPLDLHNKAAYYERDREEKIRGEERKWLLNIAEDKPLVDVFPSVPLKREDQRQVEAAKDELHKAILKEDFETVKRICDNKVVSWGRYLTINNYSAFHVAATTSNNKDFLEKMYNLPKDSSDLDMPSPDGNPLFVAADVGNTEAAKILFGRYPRMLKILDGNGQGPVTRALSNMHTETYDYLWDCQVRTNRTDHVFWHGTEILVNMISSKEYGSALDMFRKHTHQFLPTADSLLTAIAQNFPPNLNFLDRTLYRVLKDWWQAAKRKQKDYDDCKQLLATICSTINEAIAFNHHYYYYKDAILEAARQNENDVVSIIVAEFPNAIFSRNEDGHNIIQYAVINRSEKVCSLVHQMRQHKNVYKIIKDQFGNNLLHLAAKLAPTHKLSPISGAALQIQYELQWFKEVKKFVYPACTKEKNWYGDTPEMVFTKEHKELVTEGERWMKETANSFTITAALIVTIVFAAAITVPGGNDQEKGIPVFTNKTALKIFAISDAISLFTSVTSLLMFLSILTARFSEQDFLYILPTKLIIGLATLFISTTAMLVAFGAALFLMFGRDNSLTLIPIAILTVPPVLSFLFLQFPLVIDLIRATYCRNLFGTKTDGFIY